MSNFDENAYENAVIQLFEKQGYKYIHADNIHRNKEETILKDDFTEFLLRKYKTKNITSNEIEQIFNKLNSIQTSNIYQANKHFLSLVEKGILINRDNALQSQEKSLLIELVD
jgi:type I restriction enzyme R subunit